MEILDAIDAAVGCQQCGADLTGSPSEDFCGPVCQHRWHAARADALVGYREPWLRPQDFPPGVIPPEVVRAARGPWRLPDGTPVAGSWPVEWAHGRALCLAEVVVAQWEALARAVEGMRRVLVPVAETFERLARQLRAAGLVKDPAAPSQDPWERALAARRNRNTGPRQRRRAPRTIGRESTIGRR